MTKPLLQLTALSRRFAAGESAIAALRNVDLQIDRGEMVALVGASGSGKSTLLNILGCLDRPTAGSYRVASRETDQMTPDELAELRREHFGFIFQRYHLLSDLDAVANVEVPAIYAGLARQVRRARVQALLERLGLGDRLSHRPNQLSGGQQQRVSIARALVNGGRIILADEPTGALDSRAGEEVLKILGELNAEGHTIIIATHDVRVAGYARRIVEIRDGRVVSDRMNAMVTPCSCALARTEETAATPSWQALRDRFIEASRMAIVAMGTHRLRTFLTMLGIIIGIASVVSVVGLGNGSQQRVLKSISALGTNTINVYPGNGFGDLRSAAVHTLRASDAAAIQAQGFVNSATPSVSTTVTARYANKSATAQVSGVGAQFFQVYGRKLSEGSFFSPEAIERMDQVVVIDENTRLHFFGANGSAIGEFILLGNVPARIIGVTEKHVGPIAFSSNSLDVWVPYTTVLARMLGQSHVSSITVRVADDTPVEVAERTITRLLIQRHGRKDFYLSNTAEIRRTVEATTRTMTLLIGSIAAIALIVGGIGVMNIMLVSVVERTQEIGVRMAVGARQSDILQQFLVESVLVCLVGGVLGVLLALGIGVVFSMAVTDFAMIFSIDSMVAAFVCSTLIGVIFGFVPARNAARLDPVAALARE